MAGGNLDAGIAELFQRLIDDSREVVRAEVGLQRTKVTSAIARYRDAAILFAIAGVLGLSALIALMVGLILTLAPLVGPLGATAIVIGVMAVVIAVIALMARRRLRSGDL